MTDGIVIIDKPTGISSRRTVDKVSALAGQKKAGHGGTLDPAASGVLIVLLGEGCKLSRFFLNLDKSYLAQIKLGYSSDTLDSAGNIIRKEKVSLTREEVDAAVESFKGNYNHRVPQYSAKKHKGEAFYKIKRSGRTPPERIQNTFIRDIDLKDFTEDEITIKVSCSSGTYIRSLARDIASRLGTFGYLLSLRRTRVGSFIIEESADIDNWKEVFMDINSCAAKFSHALINESSAEKVKNGVPFRESDIIKKSGDISGGIFAVFSEDKRLKAIASKTGESYSLERVFNL